VRNFKPEPPEPVEIAIIIFLLAATFLFVVVGILLLNGQLR
jgi:hypothetical protein